MKKIMSLVITASMMLSLAACGNKTETQAGNSGAGKKVVLKVGATTAPDGHYVKGLEKFKENVERYSNNQVEVQIFHSSQLGNERDLVEGVALGSVEMAIVSTGPLPNFAYDFAAFDLPYVLKDRKQAYEVFDGPAGQNVLKQLEPKGIKALGYWENGFRHITNNKKEIVKPEDLKGLKIRTMENAIHMETFKQLGSTPTPMAWSEVFTALQQNVIDGQENPLVIIETAKVYEAQKYVSLTGNFYSPAVVMINKKLFDGFSKEIQDAITKAEKEARDWERNYSAELDKSIADSLKSKGVVITEVNKEEWKAATAPVYEKFKDKINPELMKALLGK